MAIKASPLTATRYNFSDDVDPDQESWVEIKPVTGRMEEIRADLLRTQEVRFDDQGYPIRRVIVNPYQLELEEMRLTFGGANIVVEGEDGKPEKLFPDETMSRQQFYEDMSKLPLAARKEWVAAVRRNNPVWLYPF